MQSDQATKVLVVKLTSMGDVLHLLPAVTELIANRPNISIDWMVEDSFTDIPNMHAGVNRVIPVATRQWRSLNLRNIRSFMAFLRDLRKDRYDYVIDAQGLIKSALLARFAKLSRAGKRFGFSKNSLKERPATWFYHQVVEVGRQQQAVLRQRQLVAGVFSYGLTDEFLGYGLDQEQTSGLGSSGEIMFFHGTTWATKHVPETFWIELARVGVEQGQTVSLSWGNEQELARAERIAKAVDGVRVLPKMSLTELFSHMQRCDGAISVDTGLGHMAAAIGLPNVSIYGATNSELTGTYGDFQTHHQMDYGCSPCLLKNCDKLADEHSLPPCYAGLSASKTWEMLAQQISSRRQTLSV